MIKNAGRYLRERRTLIVAGLLVVSCATLWAQSDGPGGPPLDVPPPGDMQSQQSCSPSVERELKQLEHLLALTVYQQSKVKVILTDQHMQTETLFRQSKPAKENDSVSADNGHCEPPSAENMNAIHDAMKTIRTT